MDYYYIPDVARLLRRSEKAVRNLIWRGKMPRPARLAGRIAWPKMSIDRWIAEELSSTGSPRRDRRGRPRKAAPQEVGK